MSVKFFGLDGEMSDSELADGAVLVQIGAAFSASDRFCSLIGWPKGSYHKTVAGMRAHGISEDAIAAADPAELVDARLYDWLVTRGGLSEKRALVPIGFNVNGFDLPFVSKFLPRSATLISRRVVDLNAPGYLLGGVLEYEGSTPTTSGWKRLAKRYAAKALEAEGVAEAWHDAGYDAAAAVLMFDFYRKAITAQF